MSRERWLRGEKKERPPEDDESKNKDYAEIEDRLRGMMSETPMPTMVEPNIGPMVDAEENEDINADQARVLVAGYDEGLDQRIRDQLQQCLNQIRIIARDGRNRTSWHMSHFPLCGQANWDSGGFLIEELEERGFIVEANGMDEGALEISWGDDFI